MIQVTISDDTYARVVAFKPVIEALLEESIESSDYVEFLLNLAPDFILADLLSNMDAQTLLQSLQQLGQKHPVQIYTYIAETMQQGREFIEAQKRAEIKQKLGFKVPEG